MTLCPDCEAGRTCLRHMDFGTEPGRGLYQTIPPTWDLEEFHAIDESASLSTALRRAGALIVEPYQLLFDRVFEWFERRRNRS